MAYSNLHLRGGMLGDVTGDDDRPNWVVVGNVGADGLDPTAPVNTPNRFHGIPAMFRKPGALFTGQAEFIPPVYDTKRFYEAQVQHRADPYSWESGPFLVERGTGKIFVGHIDPITLEWSYIPLADPTAEVINTLTWVLDPFTDNNSGHLVDPAKMGIDANAAYNAAYLPGMGPLNPQDTGYGHNSAYHAYVPGPGEHGSTGNGDTSANHPPVNGTHDTIAIETNGQSGTPPPDYKPLLITVAGIILSHLFATHSRGR